MPKQKITPANTERDVKARALFKAFTDNKYALSQEHDDAQINIKTSELKKSNQDIIRFLKTDIPASISQDMLIEWSIYALRELDDPFITNKTAKRTELGGLFLKNDFLDRLIFGKGSEEYDENAKQHQKQIQKGKEFVEAVFRSGPPLGLIFKDNLAVIRLHLDNYLSSPSHFNELEQIAITELQHSVLEIEKEKWLDLREYLYVAIHGKPGKAGEADTSAIAKKTTLAIYETYTNLYMTVGYLFAKTTAPLPDFITREDILILMILDPTRIMVNFSKNYSLLMRVGDIDTFKKALDIETGKLEAAGVKLLRVDIQKSVALLDEAAAKRNDQVIRYLGLVNESLPLLNEMNSCIEIWDEKIQHQLQIDNINDLNTNTADLNLTEPEETELNNYLAKIKKTESTHADQDIPTIKKQVGEIRDQLQSHLTTLKEMKIYIKSKMEHIKSKVEHLKSELEIIKYELANEKNINNNIEYRSEIQQEYIKLQQAYSELQEPYIEIHNKIHDIETSSEKIKLLEHHEKMKIVKLDALSNANEMKIENGKSYEKLILYSILMTRKSILEGNPSREYLNSLYMNKELNYFRHHQAPEELRNQVKLVDTDLMQATAKQLKTSSREALLKTDREYFTLAPDTKKPLKQSPPDPTPPYIDYIKSCSKDIKRQIESCTDNWSRKKVNSFWIKVMEEAYKNKDQFTFNIVMNAFKSQANPVNFSSYIPRLIMLERHWEKNTASKMEFLENTQQAINNNNYDFIPDPAVFTSHAALMQQSAREIQDSATLQTLQQFEKNYRFLQKNYHAPLSPAIDIGVLDVDPAMDAAPLAVNSVIEKKHEALPEDFVVVKPELSFQEINNRKHVIQMTLTPESILDDYVTVANKLIEYLELIKSGWDELKVDDKAHNKQGVKAPRELINDTILELKKNKSFLNIQSNLELLLKNLTLSVDIPKVSRLFRIRSLNDEYSSKQMSQINEDINTLLQMHHTINAFHSKQNKVLLDMEIPVDEPHPLSQDWELVNPLNKDEPHHASIQAPLSPDQMLPPTMPREYRHKTNHAHIRESNDKDLIKVDVSDEPMSYETKSDEEKTNIDFIIADSMISLLVYRCRNSEVHPIEILDTGNTIRMCALILVCEERGLKYKLDNEDHPVLPTLKDTLILMNANITKETRATITNSRRAPSLDNKEAGDEDGDADAPRTYHI